MERSLASRSIPAQSSRKGRWAGIDFTTEVKVRFQCPSAKKTTLVGLSLMSGREINPTIASLLGESCREHIGCFMTETAIWHQMCSLQLSEFPTFFIFVVFAKKAKGPFFITFSRTWFEVLQKIMKKYPSAKQLFFYVFPIAFWISHLLYQHVVFAKKSKDRLIKNFCSRKTVWRVCSASVWNPTSDNCFIFYFPPLFSNFIVFSFNLMKIKNLKFITLHFFLIHSAQHIKSLWLEDDIGIPPFIRDYIFSFLRTVEMIRKSKTENWNIRLFYFCNI